MIKQKSVSYLMENPEEGLRLNLKTDFAAVKRQAAWAGITPGMRILDVGCGNGAATAALAELVGETGEVVGLDFSVERIAQAKDQYGSRHITFVHHNILEPYNDDCPFDAIWSRFFLEYFRVEQRQVVQNSLAALKRGGIACLVDLDNNSLGHYGYNDRLEQTFSEVMCLLQQNHNFDPYAGRRLYQHLFDLGFNDLACSVEAHHLIYGQINDIDSYNWLKKIEIAVKNSGSSFSLYGGDFEEFRKDALSYLQDPGRFIYTPLIIARGIKPV
jgi:ubiquinone/menaquinone biosynthesis C-methylase UbiE